jgi:flagellar FliL protein
MRDHSKATPNMKADPKAAAAAPKPSKMKKIIIVAIAALLLIGVGGGAAWHFTKKSGPASAEKKEAVKSEFVVIDSFTVNLAQGEEEQYLQIQFTLEVPGPEQVEAIKGNMARVRSRSLLLLSAKKASDLATPQGKAKLAKDIIAEINKPFSAGAPPQQVSDVLFTSFIIQ